MPAAAAGAALGIALAVLGWALTDSLLSLAVAVAATAAYGGYAWSRGFRAFAAGLAAGAAGGGLALWMVSAASFA